MMYGEYFETDKWTNSNEQSVQMRRDSNSSAQLDIKANNSKNIINLFLENMYVH